MRKMGGSSLVADVTSARGRQARGYPRGIYVLGTMRRGGWGEVTSSRTLLLSALP